MKLTVVNELTNKIELEGKYDTYEDIIDVLRIVLDHLSFHSEGVFDTIAELQKEK